MKYLILKLEGMKKEEVDSNSISRRNLKIENLRIIWEQRGNKNIKYSRRPKSDMFNGHLKSKLQLFENTMKRLKDLAIILKTCYDLHYKKDDLYGDALLAFVGNSIIRNYPWSDFPFTSVNAKEIFIEHGVTEDISGLMDSEVKNKKEFKKVLPLIIYEHFSPISFFRDIFIIAKSNQLALSKEDFYELLLRNYITVRITKDEDKRLNNFGYKTNRPQSAYQEVGIQIFESEL